LALDEETKATIAGMTELIMEKLDARFRSSNSRLKKTVLKLLEKNREAVAAIVLTALTLSLEDDEIIDDIKAIDDYVV